MSEKKLAPIEYLKVESNYLRGTIETGLANATTGMMSDEDQQLLKFHGTYQQDDRDLRPGRRKHRLEKAFSFMVRIRVPGGLITPSQWLEVDRISGYYANGVVKMTTRQSIQLHGVIKSNLKRTIAGINHVAMSTIAACGDVNRNVMCNPNPYLSEIHAQTLATANQVATHLTPHTRAYHEIWLDGEKVESSEEVLEPLYGKTYLPRKFKVAFAVPPSNDVDIYASCLAFIAIVEDGKLVGYNVAVGGGMGATHGNEATYPRVADVIAFCTPGQVVDVAEKTMLVQRDFGDRSDRKHSRFKYTVDDHGPAWILAKINEYLGYELGPVRDFKFEDNGDRYGWVEDANGNSHLTIYVLNGRILDTENYELRSGLRAIAAIHDGDFRLTANQNLMIANISPEKRPEIEKLLEEYGITNSHLQSGLRLNALSCVALPSCALALAEAERFMPKLLDDLEDALEEHGLRHDAITMRITGCPNGCSRPYIAEIGIIGRGPERYNVYLGGGFAGQRLSKLYREDVSANGIKLLLSPIFGRYAKERHDGEHFGDFCIRTGIIAETIQGPDFHKNIKSDALQAV